MSQAAGPLRLLHLHSSFSPGGKELRAAKLMNLFGPGIAHTVVSGVPGGIEVVFSRAPQTADAKIKTMLSLEKIEAAETPTKDEVEDREQRNRLRANPPVRPAFPRVGAGVEALLVPALHRRRHQRCICRSK